MYVLLILFRIASVIYQQIELVQPKKTNHCFLVINFIKNTQKDIEANYNLKLLSEINPISSLALGIKFRYYQT